MQDKNVGLENLTFFIFIYKQILRKMKDIRTILTESVTQPKEIQNYIKSWLKQPSNEKEMHEVLTAIIDGAKEAYDYRTDEDYKSGDRNYEKASEELNKFIDKLG